MLFSLQERHRHQECWKPACHQSSDLALRTQGQFPLSQGLRGQQRVFSPRGISEIDVTLVALVKAVPTSRDTPNIRVSHLTVHTWKAEPSTYSTTCLWTSPVCCKGTNEPQRCVQRVVCGIWMEATSSQHINKLSEGEGWMLPEITSLSK